MNTELFYPHSHSIHIHIENAVAKVKDAQEKGRGPEKAEGATAQGVILGR